ncbi:MAG: SusC/RagA family TonB-linked outer membrane protein [Cytophagales bacterium]|nr:SusC/RagA family TonB-linked outer membrane protein [Cytophagales bacterium]
MKHRLHLSMVLLCFTLLSANAQERTVTGTVNSSEDNSEVPGVNVVVKGTTIGTITDMDGKYSIDVPSDESILVFSYIGLTTKEILVGPRSVVDVEMAPDLQELSEIVVTAMGLVKEKRSLNYATQNVDNEVITQSQQPNLANSLQGKVAGLSVRQSSGMPGSSTLMTIRGSTVLSGNNQPLMVVDGMPLESGSIFTDKTTEDRVSASDATSRSLDLNPSDIESVEVLKGPAASALYGLRAGNGVIIITTKSGKRDKGKAVINFNTAYTADIVSKTPSLQSTYGQGNGGVLNLGTSTSWGPRISEIGEYTNIVGETEVGQVYDNVGPFFETGGTYNADISVSGSGEMGNYSVSAGYTDQKGFIPTTGLKRFTGKLRGDFNASDKLQIGGTMMYSNVDVDKIASGSNLSNPLFTTYYAPRTFNLWGIPYHAEADPYTQIHYRAAMDNPRWSLANNDFNEVNDRLIGNLNFNYEIQNWLTLKYQLGVDYFTNNQKEVYELGSGETGGRTTPPSGGQLTDFNFTNRQVNSTLNLIFQKTFAEDYNVEFVLGTEFYDIHARKIKVRGTDFDIGGFHNIANTQNQISEEEILRRRVFGYYGNLTLSYRNMLYLNATGRNDKVSNLARGNRDFFYPSVGASFVFTELVESNVLSFGKLRAGWATVGQAYDEEEYPTQNIFLQGTSAVGGFLTHGIQFPFSERNAFSQDVVLRSPDLKPLNKVSWELGIDLRFLNDRITLDYTYFSSDVNDQIFKVPIPASSGYESELRNAGKLRSSGHEVAMNINPIVTNDFRWDIGVNYTTFTNEVLELAPGVANIYLGGFTTPSIRALKGGTYPSIFGVGYLRDENNRIVVLDQPGNTYHGMPLQDPVAKKIGDVQPDFEMGFANTFSYKGITLTALIDWRQGGEMYSGNNRLGRLYGALSITEDRETPVVLDAVKGYLDGDGNLVVTGENDIAIFRGEQYWSDVLGEIDEAHIHETTFVRFRELSLSYSLPSNLLQSTLFEFVSFSLIGRNLFLWTEYPNFDPETSTTGAVNGQGIEYVAHPQIASFGGRLNVTF